MIGNCHGSKALTLANRSVTVGVDDRNSRVGNEQKSKEALEELRRMEFGEDMTVAVTVTGRVIPICASRGDSDN